jgi:cytochrome c oxidase subunit 2
VRSVQSTLFALLVASNAAFADSSLNLTQGVSPLSHDIYDLHMMVLYICAVIGALVFGAMFYSMYHHRKSRGAVAKNFHSHFALEVTWTIVPALILALMAIPATRVLIKMNNDEKEDVTIKVTGFQWKWHYEYLNEGISFFSNLSTPQDQLNNLAPKGVNYLREVDNPIVVPIHKKIRFLVTSNDVNHAWWVPDLAVKRDALAGFINEGWTIIDKAGIYRGQCAELCGARHAYMPIVVVAMSEQGYADWVNQQKGGSSQADIDVARSWTMQELIAKGEKVYGTICAACHLPTGMGNPPTYPALKGDKVTTGPIAEHINTVFNGRAGTAMQAFKSQLSDTDIAAVITYERNAWGNNTGTMVQPASIKALRDGKSMADALATKPSGKVPAATPAKSGAPVAAGKTAPTATPAAPPKPASPADQLKDAIVRGEKVYNTTCVACHQVAGTGMPPTFPALKGSPIATGPKAGHMERVMFGKPGTAMQAFKDQLSDQDIADVITYERNAWGNNKGDIVTPDEVKAARNNGQDKK